MRESATDLVLRDPLPRPLGRGDAVMGEWRRLETRSLTPSAALSERGYSRGLGGAFSTGVGGSEATASRTASGPRGSSGSGVTKLQKMAPSPLKKLRGRQNVGGRGESVTGSNGEPHTIRTEAMSPLDARRRERVVFLGLFTRLRGYADVILRERLTPYVANLACVGAIGAARRIPPRSSELVVRLRLPMRLEGDADTVVGNGESQDIAGKAVLRLGGLSAVRPPDRKSARDRRDEACQSSQERRTRREQAGQGQEPVLLRALFAHRVLPGMGPQTRRIAAAAVAHRFTGFPVFEGTDPTGRRAGAERPRVFCKVEVSQFNL